MHGFVNSPALAKLVALQMIDEERQAARRRPRRRSLRARLAARRTARSAATAPAPVRTARVTAASTLVEDAQ